MVGLRDLARAFPDVRFYAISPDGPQVSRELDRKVGEDGRGKLGYSLLADNHSTIIDRYGLRDEAYKHEKINGVPHPAVHAGQPGPPL